MTEKKCIIYFGNKYININYDTDKQRELIEQFAKKFNKEYNNLLLQYGRVNSRLVLFFLLLKTQVEITEYQTGRIDLDYAMKQISDFIRDKSGKETQTQVEVDQNDIEGQLTIGNFLKDDELNKIKATAKNKPQTFNEKDVQNLTDNIFNLIKDKFKKLKKK